MKVLILFFITIFGLNFNLIQSAAAAAAPAVSALDSFEVRFIGEPVSWIETNKAEWVKCLGDMLPKTFAEFGRPLVDSTLKNARSAGLTTEQINEIQKETENRYYIAREMIKYLRPCDRFTIDDIFKTKFPINSKCIIASIINSLYEIYVLLNDHLRETIRNAVLTKLLIEEIKKLSERSIPILQTQEYSSGVTTALSGKDAES